MILELFYILNIKVINYQVVFVMKIIQVLDILKIVDYIKLIVMLQEYVYNVNQCIRVKVKIVYKY